MWLPVCLAAAATLAWLGILIYVRVMRARGRLVAANARSLHEEPVPTGAGLVVVAPVLLLAPLVLPQLSAVHISLLTACAVLLAVAWLDDLYGLPPAVRLLVHVLAAAWCLDQLGTEARVAPWMPLWIERAAEGIAWVWFINLFNFMDGIDGLAASEAIAVAAGYAVVVWVGSLDAALVPLAGLVVAVMAAYLPWNWQPARVFMGDAGSIPLGFLLGWLLLDLALRGLWAAALILPLYFVVDATVTLLRRLVRGELPHHAHREHFYQRAVLGCGSHRKVVVRIILLDAFLVALAMLSLSRASLALSAALAATALVAVQLKRI